MNTYLCAITTVLVASQLIRVTQNHIQLIRQRKSLEAELKQLESLDLSDNDLYTQKLFYKKGLEYFTMMVNNEDDGR